MGYLTVTGKSELSIDADYVKLNLNIKNTDTDYSTAIEKSTNVYNSLLGALADGGFDTSSIENTAYRVDRKTRYVDNKEEFVGHEAYFNLNIYFDFTLDNLNQAISVVSSIDDSLNYSIEFTVKDEKKYKDQLLDLAIQDAKAQAEFISSSANVKLKEISSIDYDKQVRHIVSTTRFYAMESKMAAYNPEKIELDDEINITWEITDKN